MSLMDRIAAFILILASGLGAIACNADRPESLNPIHSSQNPVDNALVLAGFVLAHAAWSISDLPKGGLIPLAVLEKSGNRQLMRFNAKTREEEISQGKDILSRTGRSQDRWAFAWENAETPPYALNVEFWAKGMGTPGRIIQEFVPPTRGAKFRIVGNPNVIVGGKDLKGSEASEAFARITEGIRQHSKVAKLWQTWK